MIPIIIPPSPSSTMTAAMMIAGGFSGAETRKIVLARFNASFQQPLLEPVNTGVLRDIVDLCRAAGRPLLAADFEVAFKEQLQEPT